MAKYFLFDNDNTISFIAESDAEKNSFSGLNELIVATASDSDFTGMKTNMQEITAFDGTNYTIQDRPSQTFFKDATYTENGLTINQTAKEQLQQYFSNTIIPRINSFVAANPGNFRVAPMNTYKNYLQSFDFDSVTYPLMIPWEKYCEDNSITYLNCPYQC